jgi:hypothetical protein
MVHVACCWFIINEWNYLNHAPCNPQPLASGALAEEACTYLLIFAQVSLSETVLLNTSFDGVDS